MFQDSVNVFRKSYKTYILFGARTQNSLLAEVSKQGLDKEVFGTLLLSAIAAMEVEAFENHMEVDRALLSAAAEIV